MANRGVSLKIRNRINKEHRLFPRQRFDAVVRIIGDPKWEADFKDAVDQGAKYLAKFGSTLNSLCPYNENAQLEQYPYPVNGILEKIDSSLGLGNRRWIGDPVRSHDPRKAGRRSRKRQWAMRALNSVLGLPDEFLLDAPALCAKTYKIDQRVKWLLDALCTAHLGRYERNFLMVIAKDAGVWPAPDWWRVTRILLGDKRFLRKRK